MRKATVKHYSTRGKRRYGLILILSLLFTSAIIGVKGISPDPVHLGSAASFSVLAGSAITNTGSTVIYGDIGLSPTTGAAITGFPPGTVSGTIYTVDIFGPAGSVSNPGLLTLAKNDLTTAYLDAAGRPTTQTISTELGGTTLGPGVYDSLAGTFGITGTLTLDGGGDPNAVFIFKMSTTLITETGSVVNLINSAHVCNVYWQVGSSATIKAGSVFVGNVLALTSITVNTGATVDGRLLARNGAVTLDGNTVGSTVHFEGIVLTPVNSTNSLGDLHVLTATVSGTGNPVVGRNVTFTVVTGPNMNLTGVDVTDNNGQAFFAYTSTFLGTDIIQATFTDSAGENVTSSQVYKTWIGTPPTEPKYVEGIVLAPISDANIIGDLHTVTATVVGTNGPVAGRNVTFTVISGPNMNLTGVNVTGINGRAIFSYTGLAPGVDVIVASFMNSTSVNVTSNQVTKTWINIPPEEIVLSPLNSTNHLGDLHTVNATITSISDPVAGRNVTFTVISGPNMNLTDYELTDVNGVASFSYTGLAPGVDVIVASFMNSTDSKTLSNQVSKTWVRQPIRVGGELSPNDQQLLILTQRNMFLAILVLLLVPLELLLAKNRGKA